MLSASQTTNIIDSNFLYLYIYRALYNINTHNQRCALNLLSTGSLNRITILLHSRNRSEIHSSSLFWGSKTLQKSNFIIFGAQKTLQKLNFLSFGA